MKNQWRHEFDDTNRNTQVFDNDGNVVCGYDTGMVGRNKFFDTRVDKETYLRDKANHKLIVDSVNMRN